MNSPFVDGSAADETLAVIVAVGPSSSAIVTVSLSIAPGTYPEPAEIVKITVSLLSPSPSSITVTGIVAVVHPAETTTDVPMAA